MTVRKDSDYEGGYEYEFNEDGMVKCPVCGEFTFAEPDDDTMCANCGWINTEFLLTIPGWRGPLHVDFEEAKKAYAEGRPIE